MNDRLDAMLAAQSLSVAKLSVLRELCQAKEPMPLGQLADRLTCVKSNVTQMVDRLEREGLVQRVPHPNDRRCMLAAVTEEGRRRCEWAIQTQMQVERQLFANLSKAEKEQLISLLAKILTDVDSERVASGKKNG